MERERYELIGAGTERGRCSIREFLLSYLVLFLKLLIYLCEKQINSSPRPQIHVIPPLSFPHDHYPHILSSRHIYSYRI